MRSSPEKNGEEGKSGVKKRTTLKKSGGEKRNLRRPGSGQPSALPHDAYGKGEIRTTQIRGGSAGGKIRTKNTPRGRGGRTLHGGYKHGGVYL